LTHELEQKNILVVGTCGGGISSPHDRQEAEHMRGKEKERHRDREEARIKDSLQGHTPSELLPLGRPHLLKFP
jgi:hypothetical protein